MRDLELWLREGIRTTIQESTAVFKAQIGNVNLGTPYYIFAARSQSKTGEFSYSPNPILLLLEPSILQNLSS